MINITPLTEAYYQQALLLANKVHGDNYLDLSSLVDMQKKATQNGINANFIALEDDNVVGLRLSYAANQWPLDEWCSPSLWPCSQANMAYFKCIAVDPNQQGKGIGPKLLTASINALKQQGAKAGIGHLWQQSPGNGAVKYFTKAGGKLIKEHKNRWYEYSIKENYQCTICGVPCHCSAAEMVIEF
ncbi:GNAT family N-acetyltransferase [Pseudoalteromonas sp. G4]|uniref:GNAT family N-acetyltransferase n=1 Tax=Pseudoalteromonas sp. G4 TaxID=2992761 RepID=UPI00237EC55C|nr:GNAT family N-acetyltransferase [Pseudoalteromonas sp. G4]MDE3273070.1 GNAT family N-acetyltransferase [Pseudoalteromonas sp. G4]